MKYVLKTAATQKPVTVAELKSHLRVEHDRDDTYIATLLDAAINQVQEYTERQLLTATWTLLLDSFDYPVKIEKPPVASIVSIKYYDEDNTEQTLSTDVYQTEVRTDPAIVELKPDQSWPDITSEREYPIEIEFTAGYTSADNVPMDIKHAIKLIVGNMYTYRDDPPRKLGMTTASQNLLAPYKRATI